jgi:hypothetical protein
MKTDNIGAGLLNKLEAKLTIVHTVIIPLAH